MIAYLLYNLFILAISPLVGIYFLWRIFISGKSRQAWREQLGFLPNGLRKAPGRKRIWLHAVSVGEAAASSPVIAEIRRLAPDVEIVLSTTTQTGRVVAEKSAGADQYLYFPIDVLPAVKASIDTVRPDVFASMETEIWPNFLFYLRLQGVRAAIVNGIVSDRTLRRGRPLRALYRAALANTRVFCMQSEEDARRIVELGAAPDRVMVTGNVKFDQAIRELPEAERAALAASFGLSPGDLVLVAGSTNPGEEEPVLEALRIAREHHPGLKLIIAPRQIERGAEIAAMCAAAGLSCGRRSARDSLNSANDVVILDTLGELAAAYALGAVAFVGGTLIRKGGHNILQPLAQGKPVFYGLHTFKIRDLVRTVEAAGVGFRVADGRQLGEQLSELLADRGRLDALRHKALALMAENRGASARSAAEIVKLVEAR